MTHPRSRPLDIAIIGGGASGTLTAVHLLRQASVRRQPLRIRLIDQHARHGLGQAYSTGDPAHLLNAMAGQMSAVSGDPDHLLKWAAADARQCSAEGGEPTSTTFLSRADYGRYVRDTLADAEHRALRAATLTRVTAEVRSVRRVDADRTLRVILADGQIDADIAVLATGNAPARLPFEVPPSERIVADPWRPGALAGLTGGASQRPGRGRPPLPDPDDGSVVIVGTGLTMLDLAVTISASNPHLVIHAVSRHGLLPRPHPGTPTAQRQLWLPVLTRSTGPVHLADLMWQVRAAIAASPVAWFDVIDALRPFVPGLWRRMPLQDKGLFLRHVARYWEVHRHLVPPATARQIAALTATGRLRVHRGRVAAVTEHADGLRITADIGGDTLRFAADWLVNGTGSTADVTATASPLLHDLFVTGDARPDPLRLGIDAAADGRVVSQAGAPSNVLFALGPPLRGVWYETTAIPEIREQAAALAHLINSDLPVTSPGSAA